MYILGISAYYHDSAACLVRDGEIISNARTYLKERPDTSFEEVFKKIFENTKVEYISGKAISSRHFEPIGTKTCQILIEGNYNGILKPDEHYICVKKDLSNIGDAIEKFKDTSYRNKIVKQAYEHVLENHTYEHRVRKLIEYVNRN